MSFRPRMTAFTEGVSLLEPLAWRAFDGIVADFWQASGKAGGGGYYLSPDPRIVIFLDEVEHAVDLKSPPTGGAMPPAPTGRAIFVPAGVPIWSRFSTDAQFRHVDLHFHEDRLQAQLVARLGMDAAFAALRAPVILGRSPEAEALAALLATEITNPRNHDFYAETLVQGIVAAILPLEAGGRARGAQASGPQTGTTQTGGGLGTLQLRRVLAYLEENLHRRVAVGELAEAVGLSESWFAHAFKRETGQTPLQWQMRRRIERAQRLLAEPAIPVAEIAAATGFADQAHLTRVFRSLTGSTPAAWRKSSAFCSD